MTIYTQEFKPTWLYIKIHNKTKLRYLGKTCERDPEKYTGSGIYWLRHIKKHGYDVTTYIIGYYTDKEDCRTVALWLSWYFDIVKSNEWANLIVENGLDSGITGRKHSEVSIQKMREIAKSRVISGNCNFQKRADGSSIGRETMQARVSAGTYVSPGLRRKDGSSLASDRAANGLCPFSTRLDGTNIQTDRVAAGTHHLLKREDGSSLGQESAMTRIAEGTHNFQNQPMKECPICHKMVNPGVYARLHGDKCGQSLQTKECPHCHRWFTAPMFARYHGNKCRLKDNDIAFQSND